MKRIKMEIKFNLFGYEFSVRVTSNDPLDRILAGVLDITNEEDRKYKIQMIKRVRTVSLDHPEWFESLGYKLNETADMHTGDVIKILGLSDGKDFVEENFEFEETKPFSWYD